MFFLCRPFLLMNAPVIVIFVNCACCCCDYGCAYGVLSCCSILVTFVVCSAGFTVWILFSFLSMVVVAQMRLLWKLKLSCTSATLDCSRLYESPVRDPVWRFTTRCKFFGHPWWYVIVCVIVARVVGGGGIVVVSIVVFVSIYYCMFVVVVVVVWWFMYLLFPALHNSQNLFLSCLQCGDDSDEPHFIVFGGFLVVTQWCPTWPLNKELATKQTMKGH